MYLYLNTYVHVCVCVLACVYTLMPISIHNCIYVHTLIKKITYLTIFTHGCTHKHIYAQINIYGYI